MNSHLIGTLFPENYIWLTPMFRSSFRSISDSQLNTSLYLHLCPIYLVVYKESLYLRNG